MSAVLETASERVKFNANTKQQEPVQNNINNLSSASPKSSNVTPSTNLNKKCLSNKTRDYRLKSESQQSILPFFLQHREVIQKQLRVEVNRKLMANQSAHITNHRINTPQSSSSSSQLNPCYALYPPSSPFSTLSKRFPYDQPHRATTSVQEIRKKILAADDFSSIKSLLLPIKYSENRSNLAAQSKLTSNEDKQKENNNIISNNNNDLDNPKDIAPPPPIIEVEKSSHEINDNNNTPIIGMSPILQQLQKNSSQLNRQLASNENVASSRSVNNRPSSSSSIHPNEQQSPQGQQPNNDNPSILKPTSAVSVTTKKSTQLKVSILSNNNNNNQNKVNIPNISSRLSHEAQAFLSDSFLQNEINKWELKKMKYTKNQAKLKKAIDLKVQDILDERGNKPTAMATTFIKDLKNIDQELQQHSSEYTLEQKRYTDRLRKFHIKKYELYHSEVKLHTAQLTHPCHQENQINNNNQNKQQLNPNNNGIHNNLSGSQQPHRQLMPSGKSLQIHQK